MPRLLTREAALESGPVMGTEQSEASASRMHDFRRTRKTERVRRVRRSRRENRNNRSREPRRARLPRPPLSLAGEYIKGHVEALPIVVVPSWWFHREVEREKEREEEREREKRRRRRIQGSSRMSSNRRSFLGFRDESKKSGDTRGTCVAGQR